MTYAPNANWTAAADASQQFQVYFLRIDGLTTKDFSTHPVKSAAVTKSVCMDMPRGGGVTIDIQQGTRTAQEVECVLWDSSDEITALISTEASGAPLSTLINRKATLYGGYIDLAEADYAPIFTGRIASAKATRDLLGYSITLADTFYLTDAKIMTNATDQLPSRVAGNPINLFYALLTGDFSVGGDFPVTDFSVLVPSLISAPTGLGLDPALLDLDGLIEERDRYHQTTLVDAMWNRPESAKAHLEKELFRVFRCFPTINGEGLLGLKFLNPPLPTATLVAITPDHIVDVLSWERAFEKHLNKFTYRGDLEMGQGAYGTPGEYNATLYGTVTDEDQADQDATGETIEYAVDSAWLKAAMGGVALARTLAGRARSMFLKTPAMVKLRCTFRMRHVEEGDIVAVTHPLLPDIQAGTRGITARPMMVLATAPVFDSALVDLTLLDASFQKYGLIAPAGTVNYTLADATTKTRYAFVANASALMSNGATPYLAS